MEPDYKWIAQDADGEIFKFHGNKPCTGKISWVNNYCWCKVENGKPNQNWRDSLIDLSEYPYSIIDGILVHGDIKKLRLTDTELLDAIVEHGLRIGHLDCGAILVWADGAIDSVNKKGDIRKAIQKWLRKNT